MAKDIHVRPYDTVEGDVLLLQSSFGQYCPYYSDLCTGAYCVTVELLFNLSLLLLPYFDDLAAVR